MNRVGHGERGHGRRFSTLRFEERGNSHHFDTLIQIGKYLRFRAKDGHAPMLHNAIRYRGSAFRMTATLMVNEIAYGSVLAHAGTPAFARIRNVRAR